MRDRSGAMHVSCPAPRDPRPVPGDSSPARDRVRFRARDRRLGCHRRQSRRRIPATPREVKRSRVESRRQRRRRAGGRQPGAPCGAPPNLPGAPAPADRSWSSHPPCQALAPQAACDPPQATSSADAPGHGADNRITAARSGRAQAASRGRASDHSYTVTADGPDGARPHCASQAAGAARHVQRHRYDSRLGRRRSSVRRLRIGIGTRAVGRRANDEPRRGDRVVRRPERPLADEPSVVHLVVLQLSTPT